MSALCNIWPGLNSIALSSFKPSYWLWFLSLCSLGCIESPTTPFLISCFFITLTMIFKTWILYSVAPPLSQCHAIYIHRVMFWLHISIGLFIYCLCCLHLLHLTELFNGAICHPRFLPNNRSQRSYWSSCHSLPRIWLLVLPSAMIIPWMGFCLSLLFLLWGSQFFKGVATKATSESFDQSCRKLFPIWI